MLLEDNEIDSVVRVEYRPQPLVDTALAHDRPDEGSTSRRKSGKRADFEAIAGNSRILLAQNTGLKI